MKTRRFIFAALSVLCGLSIVSCQKDAETPYSDNNPVQGLSVSFNVPVEESTMTKANTDIENAVENVTLILISKSDDEAYVVGPQTITDASAKVNFSFEGTGATGGEYYLYAVANANKNYMAITSAELQALNGKTKAQVDAYLVSKGNTDLDIAESAILMTGKYCNSDKSSTDGSVTLYGEGNSAAGNTNGDNVLDGSIVLRRIVSKQTITFVNGDGVTFTPTSYSIYEYSHKTTLMERDGWDYSDPNTLTSLTGNVYNSKENVKISGSSFSFYMPENVQIPTETLDEYADRERHTNLTSTQSFANAPENATYVVVTGNYKDATYTGTATYTIHLGDFSVNNSNSLNHTPSGHGAYGNFSVRRNYSYQYHIKINGVNNIIAECQATDLTPSTEPQPGAEGQIVKTGSKTTYTLDAHYEQVYLEFTKPSSSASYYININTPYSNITNTLVANLKSTDDYMWVTFAKPTSSSSAPFQGYPGSDNVTDINGLVSEIANGSGDHITVSNGIVKTVAYVNEYFYDSDNNMGITPALSNFINASDRSFSLSTSETQYSQDGKSSYTDNGNLFSLTQESIKSIQNLDSSNPFGIETIEETSAARSSNFPTEPGSSSSGSMTYGWNNFYSQLGISSGSTKWSKYLSVSTNGHTSSSTSSISSAMASSYDYGFYQCMSRNRDEDGDGKVDQDEVKWYLPAFDQYCILFLGENDLETGARLYQNGNGNTFYSSTYGDFRIYWGGQGLANGPYSGYFQNGDDGADNAQAKTAHIRCARSLKTYNAETSSVATTSNNIITISNLSDNVLRTSPVTVEYPLHVQRDASNSLTYQFEVATNNLTLSTYTDVATEDICSGVYSQSGDSDGWRVPNEKEFYLMQRLGLVDSSTYNYGIRTVFGDSASSFGSYFGWNMSQNQIFTFTASSVPTSAKVRCVRDYSNSSSTTQSSSGSSSTVPNSGTQSGI